ncbi:MAG: nuclear transport factor 2 family protein [Bacteroidota bacterium]
MIDFLEKVDTIAYPEAMKQKPFFDLTVELLDCVRDHNFDRLSQICNDDFGIIDINTEGGAEIIRDREGWENWFTGLFGKLKAMNALTWSEITNYEALKRNDMGYCVVDFDQMFVVGAKRMRFSVISTIIWKKEGSEWKESRYHCSLIGVKDESLS